MHTLFKDYLRLQFEYNAHAGEKNHETARLRGNLGGFKMYTIEEMVLWLKRERAWSMFYFWSKFHKNHIKSWQSTVQWHLDQCSVADIIDFRRARSCYGPDMKTEVYQSLKRRQLKARDEFTSSSLDVSAPAIHMSR